MGLRLVARYYDRSEAVVVSATLDAAGIPNWIENFNQIALRPFEEIALHGYRIMVVEQDVGDAVDVIREARRKRSFEGERLSQNSHFVQTALLWLVLAGYLGIGLWLPFRRYKWHDVSETPS